MGTFLSEMEIACKAYNDTKLFTFEPSDTFYWRDILNNAKDKGFVNDVKEWQWLPGEQKEDALIALYEKLLTAYDEEILMH